MTFPFPIVAPSVSASVVYCDQQSQEPNLSTYTFPNVGIGTASSDRFIICAVIAPSSAATPSLTSVTIGGNPATQLCTIKDAVALSNFALYGLAVPTGTTATIVVNLSASPNRCGVMTWAAYNLISTTPIATATSNATTLNTSIAVQAGGILVGASGQNGGTAPDWSWTNLTERVDVDCGDPGAASMSGASDSITASSSPSITATCSSGNNTRQGLVLASMR